jgi:NADPH:quinone reductase
VRAIRFDRHGDYDTLCLIEAPCPQPAAGEVLVRLSTAAVTPLDDRIRRGLFPGSRQPPLIPGVEGVGHVLSPGTADRPSGSRVIITYGGVGYGVTEDGTWREFLVSHPKHLIPVPGPVRDEQVVAIVHAYVPAQLALTLAGELQPGATVVVPALEGGVGDALLRLARAHGMGRVICYATDDAQAARVRAAGHDAVIDLARRSLADGVGELTAGAGADLVVENRGGDHVGEAVAALRDGGAVLCLAHRDDRAARFDAGLLIAKRARILGCDLMTLPHATVRHALDSVLRLVESGRLHPAVDRIFALDEAAAAQRYVVEEQPFGQVVLRIGDP